MIAQIGLSFDARIFAVIPSTGLAILESYVTGIIALCFVTAPNARRMNVGLALGGSGAAIAWIFLGLAVWVMPEFAPRGLLFGMAVTAFPVTIVLLVWTILRWSQMKECRVNLPIAHRIITSVPPPLPVRS